MTCATRWPKVICASVGLKENLSGGMVSTAPCRFLAWRGMISLMTVVTGFLHFCAKASGSAPRARTKTSAYFTKAYKVRHKAYSAAGICANRKALGARGAGDRGRDGGASVRPGFFLRASGLRVP